MKYFVAVMLACLAACCLAQEDGSYHPTNEGQYVPDFSGAYSAEGQYYQDNSGAYAHDNSGDYKPEYHIGAEYTGNGLSGQRTSFIASTARPGAFGAGAFGQQGGRAGAFGPSTTPGFGQGFSSGIYSNRNYAIIRQSQDIGEDGYHYLYETENGIKGEEQGKLFNKNTDAEALRANGYFSYTGPDNVVYTVTYVADENGFQPQGAHLPVAPAIPDAILRSLDYLKSRGELRK